MGWGDYAGYLGGIGPGAWWQSQDGYEDPAKAAEPWLDKIPGQVGQYLNPYIQQGQGAYDTLNNQYGNMINDPGGMVNKIGGGYQQSPGFKFALQQALQGAGHAAAAGGMAGSPEHEQQNMGIATQLANQDYNQWLGNALGMYGAGMSGEQDIYGKGYGASSDMAQAMNAYLQSKGQLGYAGAANRNQYNLGQEGMLLGAAGNAAKAYSGGGGVFY